MTNRNGDAPGEPADIEVTHKMDMVGWYRPSVLVRTGLDTLISTIFGRHSDYRLLEALATDSEKKEEVFYDYTHHYKVKDAGEIRDGENADWYARDDEGDYEKDENRKRAEIWIDYVADTGDGWNSTYAVAYAATKDELAFDVSDSPAEPVTKRGHLLIFGGDQVYPVASRKEYANRLIKPYETALGSTEPRDPAANRTDPHPFVFATPGNHDWYDSLVSFTRLFCARRWFAGWRTRQTRSYYALRLPQHWWLIGIDVQLGSDLDGAQVRFFEEVVKHMEEGDRVILCTAEPHWVLGDLYQKYDEQYNDSNLKFFEEKILGRKGAQVHVYLSGDLHHYRRHEHVTAEGERIQKITAGGGGAFLHPTHRMGRIKPEYDAERETITDSVKSREERAESRAEKGSRKPKVRVFRLEKSFPEPDESKKACRRNLKFLKYNPYFGLLTAILYWLSSWVVVPYTQEFFGNQATIPKFWDNFSTVVTSQFPDAGLTFWLTLIIAGFVLFTDTHSKWYRWVAGLAHGIAHVVALLLLCVLAYWAAWSWFGLGGKETLGIFKLLSLHLMMALIIFAGGWIAGSCIMGIYLWLSMNIFGRHYNEAFSSLKIEDWKHFLRLHIGADGALDIYPIGLPKVPRAWKRNTDFKAHRKALSVPAATEGRDDKLEIALIEPPIHLPGKRADAP